MRDLGAATCGPISEDRPGIKSMEKRTYQAALYSLALALLILNNALLVFEVRTALNIAPRMAMVSGAAAALTAVFLIVRAYD